MLNFIQQPGGVTFIHQGQSVSVAKSDKCYGDVLDAIKRKAPSSEIVAILREDEIRMTKATEVMPGITLKGGQLYYQDEPIAGVLGDRMLQMLDEGFDLAPMVKFLGNLLKNPSHRVVENLYAFLEVGKNPITEDGCFLAYKAIAPNWRDIHSGRFDNSIGAVLEMPRHRVDEDPHRTCSSGFHVCSFDYLAHFAQANGHVVVCKVNPADVVAIPADYRNTKMRTARYEVIAEYEGYYTENSDILAKASVAIASVSEPFVVEARESGTDAWLAVSASDNLIDAAQDMADRKDDDDSCSLRLVNFVTGTVLDIHEPEIADSPWEENDDEDLTGEAHTFAYSLRGRRGIGPDRFVVLDGYGTQQEAVLAAVTLVPEFDVIEVCDRDGTVITSIR